LHLYIFLRHTCTLHLLVLSSIVEIILVMLLFAVEQLLWIFRIERLRKDRLLLFQLREQVRMNTKNEKESLTLDANTNFTIIHDCSCDICIEKNLGILI